MTPPLDYVPTDLTTWAATDLAEHALWLSAPGVHTVSTCWRCRSHPSRGGRICAVCVREEQARRAGRRLAGTPDDWRADDAKGATES